MSTFQVQNITSQLAVLIFQGIFTQSVVSNISQSEVNSLVFGLKVCSSLSSFIIIAVHFALEVFS
jgi:hypothetical protein